MGKTLTQVTRFKYLRYVLHDDRNCKKKLSRPNSTQFGRSMGNKWNHVWLQVTSEAEDQPHDDSALGAERRHGS